MRLFTCLVCGYESLPDRTDWDICPICFWEDDVLLRDGDQDQRSPANHLLVSQAQANFVLYGACDPKFVAKVQPPGPRDRKDPTWALLPRAQELLQSVGGG